jgi:hypothetical protein
MQCHLSLPGTYVCEYVGERITEEEADRRCEQYDLTKNSYVWQLPKIGRFDGYAIDATNYGSLSRYINHSCSPNLFAHTILTGGDERLGRVAYFAKNDIKANEGLIIDYRYIDSLPDNSACYDERLRDSRADPLRSIKCGCDSRGCKKYLYYIEKDDEESSEIDDDDNSDGDGDSLMTDGGAGGRGDSSDGSGLSKSSPQPTIASVPQPLTSA